MNKKTFKANSVALATALLLCSGVAKAQMDTSFHVPAVFYDELHNITAAFADTTNSDTLVLTQLDVSGTGYFTGNEILSSEQVIDLIDTYDFMNDNGDNNLIFGPTSTFTYDNKSFEKMSTYAVERKTFNVIKLNGVQSQNKFCLHIRENLYITRADIPESPIEIQNNYYVIVDNNVIEHISAYQEALMEKMLSNGKYYDASPANKSTSAINRTTEGMTSYFTVMPNPATSTVNFKIMMAATDNAKIIIADMLGRKVKEINCDVLEKSKDYSFSYNVSNLNAGVYNAMLVTKDSTKTLRLVVSK